jgi:NAD+ kinase
MSEFSRVGIIVKPPALDHEESLNTLTAFLEERGLSILLDDSASQYAQQKGLEHSGREELASSVDLVVVVGGDGTLLNAARSLADVDVAVVGINLGRLGFLVDVSPEEIQQQLEPILAGDYIEERRMLLSASVFRDKEKVGQYCALNDVTLHVRDVVRMIEFETHINGHFVNIQRADGMVVSTPTGSTAYALSSGGPILHPTLDTITLVPICPHTLSHRPLVVSGDNQIEIRVCDHSRNSGQVAFDGQYNIDLLDQDRIVIDKHDHCLRLIHPPSYDYYHILRAKLRWSEQP